MARKNVITPGWNTETDPSRVALRFPLRYVYKAFHTLYRRAEDIPVTDKDTLFPTRTLTNLTLEDLEEMSSRQQYTFFHKTGEIQRIVLCPKCRKYKDTDESVPHECRV
jgi:hypothetical protein